MSLRLRAVHCEVWRIPLPSPSQDTAKFTAPALRNKQDKKSSARSGSSGSLIGTGSPPPADKAFHRFTSSWLIQDAAILVVRVHVKLLRSI